MLYRETDLCDPSENCEHSHRQFLMEFEERVWPWFQERNYSKDAALNYWMQCKVLDRLDTLTEKIEEKH